MRSAGGQSREKSADDDRSPGKSADEDRSPGNAADEDRSPGNAADEDRSPGNAADEDRSPGNAADEEPADEEPADEEWGLDELSARSGVTPRTIRFYQSSGVLPLPRKDGRDARYRLAHLERLRMISELQERGLKLEAIRALVARTDATHQAATWLGLDEALRDPWTGDRPLDVSADELHRRLGGRSGRLREDLAGAGLIDKRDDGSFHLPSPALLDLAVRLVDSGVGVDVANRAAAILRARLAEAADDLVVLFAGETGRSFAGQGTPEDVAVALGAVRPIALDAAGLLLAHEMERALAELAETVPAAGLTSRP
jgi:DNA-binding transcriptional MerR regulator